MIEEVDDILDTEDYELGYSPLAFIIIATYALIGIALYLNPLGDFFEVRLAGLLFGSMALAKMAGLQRWENQGNLKQTLIGGALAASFVGIFVFTMDVAWAYTFSTVSLLGLLAKSIPCVFEELTFRGGLLLGFMRVMGTKGALILQGFLFAVWHSYIADVLGKDLLYFIVLWAGGIALGVAFLWTKDILSPILGHHVINLKSDAGVILKPQIFVLLFVGIILFYVSRRLLD